MVRTLHLYLARDLARIAVLALGAFTLVMTVFAVMEPLRKQGLSTEQVISLFGFTLPTMVSLTLPVAALFATTIVYGRFSQENELLAANASGISTLRLLRPALTLGVLISVATLALSNFVTPRMAAMASMAVESNIKEIFYNKLRTQGYLDHGGYIIHAQHADPDQNLLLGVVMVNAKKKDDMELVSAGQARIFFDTNEQGEYFATVHLHDAVAVRPSQRHTRESTVIQQSFFPLDSVPLRPPMEEEPSWYDWGRLLDMLAHPEQNQSIQRSVNAALRRLSHDSMLRELKAAVESGRAYDRLKDREYTYLVRAGKASVVGYGSHGKLYSADKQRVEVEMRKGNQAVRTIRADGGWVQPTWSARPYQGVYEGDASKGKSMVTLRLEGNVTVEEAGSGPVAARTHRCEEWAVGSPEVPQDLVDRALTHQDSMFHPGPDEPAWVKKISEYLLKKLGELKNDLLAALHVRVAYGVSCFLMVAMGAALGVLFRGGQMITAFTLSVVPAFVVIVMLVMGKQIVRNPDMDTAFGLLAIWGGIGLLALANVVLYWRLVRR